MKITHIRFWKEDLNLTRPYTIAYKTVSDVSVCFVEIETDGAHVGIGASNPSPQVVGETVADVMQVLNLGQGFDQIIGRDVREMVGILKDVGEIYMRNPGVLAALDIALHDIWGKYLDLPIARFYGQAHHSIPTSITVGIKGVEETLEEVEEYIGRGFRFLKIKTGEAVEKDLERLFKIREIHGDQVHIRVDANQGYTLEQLQDFMERGKDLNLELIEQPLSADQVGELLQLPWAHAEKIALDESVRYVDEALAFVGKPLHAGIFNIKLMKCGGIRNGLRIADLAQMAGMHLMWGCNDESRVSIAAALHAAFASPATRYLDLDGSLDLARDLVEGGFKLKDGMMSLLPKPGLGVDHIS